MFKKVLLVADDDAMSRMIISRFLSSEYTVLEAENGRMAMKTLAATHVDALLLDIIMPQMDGLEVLKELRNSESNRDLAVLVASSLKEKTERMVLELGADDVVSKPYDPVVIKKRLQNMLAAKALERDRHAAADDGMEAAVREAIGAARRKTDKAADQIYRCCKLIRTNKENFALVDEMLAEIEKQAKSLTSPEQEDAKWKG